MDLTEFQKQIANAIFVEIQNRAEKIGIEGDDHVPHVIMNAVLSEAQTAVVSVYLSLGGDLFEFVESVAKACIEHPNPEAK